MPTRIEVTSSLYSDLQLGKFVAILSTLQKKVGFSKVSSGGSCASDTALCHLHNKWALSSRGRGGHTQLPLAIATVVQKHGDTRELKKAT